MIPYIILNDGETYTYYGVPTTLDIKMLAHALSMLCRFTGHTKEFYSVAQHSVMVSYLVPRDKALLGLLHDAHEALVGDMATPLKSLLPGYRVLEERAQTWLAAIYGLPVKHPPEIKQADLVALATERRDLLPHEPTPWSILDGIEPVPSKIIPLTPADAKQQFLRRYYSLTNTT